MIKKNYVQIALLCVVACPIFGQACAQGDDVKQVLNQDYSSISPFDVAGYLGIDNTCNGRRLYKLIMRASSSAGPGLATLIVNGMPVGLSQHVTATSDYVFQLDPVYNYLGSDVTTFEIRLSGDFDVDYVEAILSDATDSGGDYWEHYGYLVGTTPLVGADTTSTSTITVASDMYPIERLVFVARQGDFNLNAVILHFDDGTEQSYGAAMIPQNSAVRIDLADTPQVTSIVIVGSAETAGTTAQIEVRGLHQINDSDPDARSVRGLK